MVRNICIYSFEKILFGLIAFLRESRPIVYTHNPLDGSHTSFEIMRLRKSLVKGHVTK